jgi:hypothetical protein
MATDIGATILVASKKNRKLEACATLFAERRE